jgi:atlastin
LEGAETLPTAWLEDKEQKIGGFHWTSGAKRDTTGIWIWGKPVVIRRKCGPIAVVLLDTQGMFDNDTSYDQCTKIFALSTLISSVQVIISKVINLTTLGTVQSKSVTFSDL